MVLTWGMSDLLGPISYSNDAGFDEKMYVMPGEKEYSEKTAEQIDNEIKNITDQAYADAKGLIEQNKEKLENVALSLLKYETLDADDVQLILDGGTLDKPTVADLLAAEQAKSENDDKKEKEPEKGNIENEEQDQSAQE
jgi:cell division protease FtsH